MEFSRAQLREFERDIAADFSLPQDPNELSFCICRSISAADIICAVMETVVVGAINQWCLALVHAAQVVLSYVARVLSGRSSQHIGCTSLLPAFLFMSYAWQHTRDLLILNQTTEMQTGVFQVLCIKFIMLSKIVANI